MTNEEAKAFLDNLKICIDEHPIVADWLVEIADRKTKNNSEKPNNSTVSKMEQVDKPTTQTETQNSNLTFKTLEYCDICDHKGCDECAKEYEELGLKELKELIEADRKALEQTEREGE